MALLLNLKGKLDVFLADCAKLEQFHADMQDLILDALTPRCMPTPSVTAARPTLSDILNNLGHRVDELADLCNHDADTETKGQLGAELVPILPPRPETTALLELAKKLKESGDRVVWSRMDSLIRVVDISLQHTDHAWQQQNILLLGTSDAMTAFLDNLLQTFYVQIRQMCTRLKQFTKDHFLPELLRAAAHTSETQTRLLAKQDALNRRVHTKLEEETRHMDEMLELLETDTDALVFPPGSSTTRADSRSRLRALRQRSRAISSDARVYYLQPHTTMGMHPASSTFCRAIQQWLVDYQKYTIDHVRLAQSVPPASSSTPAKRDPAVRSSTFQTLPIKRDWLSVSSPAGELMKDLLLGYTTHRAAETRTAVTKLEVDAKRFSELWQAASDTVSQLEKKDRPTTARDLLALDRQSATAEAAARSHWSKLFEEIAPTLTRHQAEAVHLAQMAEFLKSSQQRTREWEVVQREECALIGDWQAACAQNARFVVDHCSEWECFVGGQLEQLHMTLATYYTHSFEQVRVACEQCTREGIRMATERSQEQAIELELLDTLCNDLRGQNIEAADEVARFREKLDTWKRDGNASCATFAKRKLGDLISDHRTGLHVLLKMCRDDDDPAGGTLPLKMGLVAYVEVMKQAQDVAQETASTKLLRK